MAKKHTVQCASGAVKFEFDADPTFVAVGHCLDCLADFPAAGERPNLPIAPQLEEIFCLLGGPSVWCHGFDR
jgi:hypothetical protein